MHPLLSRVRPAVEPLADVRRRTPSPGVAPAASSTYRSGAGWRAYNALATALDRRFGWDKLPLPLALAVLVGVRNELRRHNLHDSNLLPSTGAPPVPAPPADETVRSVDGSYNDLTDPGMGMAGARFGRNVPLASIDADPEASLLSPNPREVSRRLMTRGEFLPATSVNVLVTAWLQFMIRDWFSHGHGDAQRSITVPLAADDPWPQNPMLVPRTVTDPSRPPDASGPPSSVNVMTHWWDMSSIYGVTQEEVQERRTHVGGHLHVGPDGVVPLPDSDPHRDPTREPGFWVGMGMLASLFALEHNAICDALSRAHPDWDDDQLFERARLVNAATVAKIHTVEWTPAVIAHPVTKVGMRGNWFGLAGERFRRRFGRIGRGEVLSGIPGSETQHYGVPFSLTEEFTAVYRMHPLLPDDFRLKRSSTGEVVRECEFPELAGPQSRQVFADHSLADLFYSFGTEYAGAIVLRNFPRALQTFIRPNDGKPMDLAAVDLIRVREAGIPRYNEMRRLLRLRPAASFSELTDDADVAATLADLYGDVEQVDLMVGMFAEKRPQGFAFSDTAFRIFILMASRRLNSDRFFTRDYDPRVYSETGMRWIEDATMAGILLRHWPQLSSVLPARANAFQPWPGTAAGRG